MLCVPPAAAPLGPTARPTALVVDDLRINRLILTQCLRKLGFDVLEAVNGLEGVQVFRREQKSLRIVFCDLQMPVLDGLGALSSMRAIQGQDEERPQQACRRVPLVLCTASSLDDVLLERAALDGADQAVSKPLCMEAVQSILNRHVPDWRTSVC